jgi:hypothetical protein
MCLVFAFITQQLSLEGNLGVDRSSTTLFGLNIVPNGKRRYP